MKAKFTDFLKLSVVALEEMELLCAIVADTGRGMIILLQAPQP
jgi:hypothetical protein